MIDLSVIENLKKLKDKFFGEDDSALEQIKEWEKRVKSLSEREDYANLFTTKEIAQGLKDRVKDFLRQRSMTRETDKLMELDAKIAEDKFLMKLLCANPEKEIEEINDLVLNELTDD